MDVHAEGGGVTAPCYHLPPNSQLYLPPTRSPPDPPARYASARMLDFQAKLAGQLSSALEHTHCARNQGNPGGGKQGVYTFAQCTVYVKEEKLTRRKSASLDLESAPLASSGGGSKLDAKGAQANANAPQPSGDASSVSMCALPVCESLHCGSASTTTTSSSSSTSSAKADTTASLREASKMLHEDSTQLVNTLHGHLKHHCLHNAMFDDQMFAMKHRIDKQFDQIIVEDQRPPTPSSASTAATPASRNVNTFLYVNRSDTLLSTHTHTRTRVLE